MISIHVVDIFRRLSVPTNRGKIIEGLQPYSPDFENRGGKSDCDQVTKYKVLCSITLEWAGACRAGRGRLQVPLFAAVSPAARDDGDGGDQ